MKWYTLVGPVIFVLALILRMFNLFSSKRTLSSFDQSLSRERLVQGARIIIIDDEDPLLIAELRSAGFAIDHDRLGSDLHNIDQQIYDLAIVDYQGVGQRLGSSQGLDLVKHIRRVSPRTRVIAHTSRSLTAAESEFFVQSHAVLPKDLGLGDSLALVEAELHKAFSKEHLLESLLAKLNIRDPKETERIRAALVKSLSKEDPDNFKQRIEKIAGTVGEKAVDIIISRLFDKK